MKTATFTSKPIPVHYLQFPESSTFGEDYDVRRLAIKGYAHEKLSRHSPAILIVLCDGSFRHTWLAVLTPKGDVLTEYVMYATHLLLEGTLTINEAPLDDEVFE